MVRRTDTCQSIKSVLRFDFAHFKKKTFFFFFCKICFSNKDHLSSCSFVSLILYQKGFCIASFKKKEKCVPVLFQYQKNCTFFQYQKKKEMNGSFQSFAIENCPDPLQRKSYALEKRYINPAPR